MLTSNNTKYFNTLCEWQTSRQDALHSIPFRKKHDAFCEREKITWCCERKKHNAVREKTWCFLKEKNKMMLSVKKQNKTWCFCEKKQQQQHNVFHERNNTMSSAREKNMTLLWEKNMLVPVREKLHDSFCERKTWCFCKKKQQHDALYERKNASAREKHDGFHERNKHDASCETKNIKS